MQRIKMYYDPRGQVIRTVNPDKTEQRVVFGVPITLSEVEGFAPSPWETYSYDANDLDTSSPHYATPKSAEVDALGRTIKTLDRLESSDSTSNNVQMLYEYDIRGNLLNVKDAYDRTVFEHVYDLQTPAKEGESIPPLKTTHINKGTSTVVFDCTGKPVETRDAKGALTLHGYDVLQRPIKMWCKDNNSETTTLRQNSIFGDNADQNNNGKLVEHFDEGGYEKIDSYDFKGNVLQKLKQVINNNEILNAIQNSQNNGWNTIECYRVDWTGLNMALLSSTIFQTNMEYDGLNRLKKITYPADTDNSRKELIPLYNKAGALQKVQFDGTEYVKEIAYNAKGQRLLIAYGNGLMTRYCYNEKTFRLSRLKTEGYTYTQAGNEHQYNYNAGTVRQDFAYTYDKGGNIISINDVTPQCGIGASDELRRDFTYDALYRLLSATGRDNKPNVDFPRWDDTTRSDDPNNTKDYTQTYSYDLMGNINELQHQGENNFTRSFDYSNNLLNSIAVGGNNYTFEYDVCGNQTRENQERQFNWDYADRLKLYYNQVNPGQEPSTYAHYLYDAGGNRVKKLIRTQGGGWECITYIDGLIEYRENHNGQQQSISHIMDDSKRIASIRKGHDFEDTTPEVKYNMDDHLGSSNLSVDENGTLVNREEYYPFGETSFGSYSKKRYRFCGKEKDEESGLYYYGARYYSPWTCRFISVDPQAGKYISQTPFAYADNNPICKMDFNGEGTGDPPKEVVITASRPKTDPAFRKWLSNFTYEDLLAVRDSIYESKLSTYRGGLGKALYGTDINGCVQIPEEIKAKLFEQANNELMPTIKMVWVLTQVNFDPNSIIDAFNPIKRIALIRATALTVSSKEEAKQVLAQTSLELAGMWLTRFSFKTKPINSEILSKTKAFKVDTSKDGTNLAFGLRGNLNEFSDAMGFSNYRQFTSGGFKPKEIEAAIENTSNNLHFNLTDFTKWKYTKYSTNPTGPTMNNITNWELYTIYNTPGALQRTTFYKFINGSYQVVPKPF